MKLTFLGTRGYIEPWSLHHRRHTSTLVGYRGRSVLLDYGEDWRGKAEEIAPRAIVITHAHPDHAFGLRAGAPCPVYATRQAWEGLKHFPLPPDRRRVIRPRNSTRIEGMWFEAFPVVHSTRAPAVGYRITAGGVSIFYVPDVTSGMKAALNGVPSLSVMDGWWVEGHIEGLTGWSIAEPGDRPTSSREDAAALYEKLEGSVVPMFYRQPDRFVDVMRHAIALNGSFFHTQRMLQEYLCKAYNFGTA